MRYYNKQYLKPLLKHPYSKILYMLEPKFIYKENIQTFHPFNFNYGLLPIYSQFNRFIQIILMVLIRY